MHHAPHESIGGIDGLTLEAIERMRLGVPEMMISKQNQDKRTRLNRQRKEDERMKAAGYSKEFSGGRLIWKKGTI